MEAFVVWCGCGVEAHVPKPLFCEVRFSEKNNIATCVTEICAGFYFRRWCLSGRGPKP